MSDFGVASGEEDDPGICGDQTSPPQSCEDCRADRERKELSGGLELDGSERTNDVALPQRRDGQTAGVLDPVL